MAGGLDKGLSSSMWSPVSTGLPPYHFKKQTRATALAAANSSPAAAAPSSSSAAAAAAVAAVAHVSSPSTPSNKTANTPSSISTGGTSTTAATTPSPTSNGNNSNTQGNDLLAAALNRIPTPWAELDRFTKIARRLRWKLPFLAHGYNAATAPVEDADVDGAAQRAEAELMFKLDFFEYYMLLERALVHLMGVFGIRITGGFNGVPKSSNGTGAADSARGGEKSDHRFHANVLEALDDVRNPLHHSLGRDDVRYALARAKELRNRWKNADDPDAALASANNNHNAARTRPLKDYDLDRILRTIFAGFDEGHAVAQQFVAEVRTFAVAKRNDSHTSGTGVGGTSTAGSVGNSSGNDMDMDWAEDEDGEGEWEFMTDAMDWQAV